MLASHNSDYSVKSPSILIHRHDFPVRHFNTTMCPKYAPVTLRLTHYKLNIA